MLIIKLQANVFYICLLILLLSWFPKYHCYFVCYNLAYLTLQLIQYGINGNIVRVKGSISSPFPAPSGVLQGSNLSPLLFIAFINDIKQCIDYCKIILYADDAMLYTNIKSDLDRQYLQRILDNVV